MGTRIAVALCLFAVVGIPSLPSAASLAAPSIQTSEPQQQYYLTGVVAKPGPPETPGHREPSRSSW